MILLSPPGRIELVAGQWIWLRFLEPLSIPSLAFFNELSNCRGKVANLKIEKRGNHFKFDKRHYWISVLVKLVSKQGFYYLVMCGAQANYNSQTSLAVFLINTLALLLPFAAVVIMRLKAKKNMKPFVCNILLCFSQLNFDSFWCTLFVFILPNNDSVSPVDTSRTLQVIMAAISVIRITGESAWFLISQSKKPINRKNNKPKWMIEKEEAALICKWTCHFLYFS